VDKREKFFAYTSIETLEEYVLVAQDAREVTIFHRATNWKAETVSGARATLKLESLGFKIPFASIYEGV
jgi:Uma2 family endonuclease